MTELFHISVLGADEPSEDLKALAQRIHPHEDSKAYWQHWKKGGLVVATDEKCRPVGFLGFSESFECETGAIVDSIPSQKAVEGALVKYFQALRGRNSTPN